MKDYVSIVEHENRDISVCLYVEHSKPMEVGAKIEEINENAYMNGYNWEAFFNYYLLKYAPNLIVNMDTDPEAGMYVANYTQTVENTERANKFAELICSLIEEEIELYRIITDEGKEIEWD